MRRSADRDAVEALAKKLAGNHLKFGSFGWSDRPTDGERWALVYTQNRDSDACDRSNHRVFLDALRPFLGWRRDGAHTELERHSHWAVGWVEGFAIRVYTPCGRITRAFWAYASLVSRLEDYPVLDEAAFSEEEREEADQAWATMRPRARLEYLRDGRFHWHDWRDLLGCVRGHYAPSDEGDGYAGLLGC